MATTKGPLGSESASGSLAKILTFSSWKGRNTVRLLTEPTDPRTGLQLSARAMMRFLSRAWTQSLDDADRATWSAPAQRENITPIASFIAYNLERWRQFLGVTMQHPAANISGTSNQRTSYNAANGVGQITITYNVASYNDDWAAAIHIDPTNVFVPSRATLRAVNPELGGVTQKIVITRVTPGVWWTRLQRFSKTGRRASTVQLDSATVT